MVSNRDLWVIRTIALTYALTRPSLASERTSPIACRAVNILLLVGKAVAFGLSKSFSVLARYVIMTQLRLNGLTQG